MTTLDPFRQRFDDRDRSDVGVQIGLCPGRSTTSRRYPCSPAHVPAPGGIESIQQIIAGDYSDAQLGAGTVLLGATAFTAAAQARGLHRRRWRPLSRPGRQRPAAHSPSPRRVTRVAKQWIAFLLLLQNRHRDFGEIVEHQVVRRAVFDLAPRSIEIVAPESLTGGDPNDFLQLLVSPRCGGSTNAPRCGPGLWSVARRARLSISRVFSGYTMAST